MTVGLVPYADSAFNRGSFPLKTLEYLAGGRATIATDLPSVRWLSTDLVTRASSEQFAGAVEMALSIPTDPAVVDSRRAFARTHDWDQRAREFGAAIGIRPPP